MRLGYYLTWLGLTILFYISCLLVSFGVLMTSFHSNWIHWIFTIFFGCIAFVAHTKALETKKHILVE